MPDDIITAFMRLVPEAAPAMTGDALLRIEAELRAEFGGKTVYVLRTRPANRVELPVRHDQARGKV